MRIAFIGQKGFPASWGGVEVHVDALARRLAERGHEVVAYVRRWYSPKSAENHAVHTIALPTVRTKHLDAALHSGLAAFHSALARGREVDIVHFHAIGPALFTPIPRLAGISVVTTVHGKDYQRAKWGPIARASLRAGEQIALRASHRVIAVSRQLADDYRHRGVDAVYIPNGVEITPPPAAGAFDHRPFVLSLGRWVPEKRVVELVSAFAARDRGFELIVAGDADDGEYRRQVRAAAGSSGRVRFVGMVGGEAKAELLAQASGFVTHSELEGLPIALLEAVAAGLPVAASDIPPHREVLGDLAPKALYPPHRLAEALDSLCAAITAGVDGAALSRRRAAIAAEYSWDQCAARHEELYQELVCGS